MVEHISDKDEVESSNLSRPTYGAKALVDEHKFCKLEVVDSSSTGSTKNKFGY